MCIKRTPNPDRPNGKQAGLPKTRYVCYSSDDDESHEAFQLNSNQEKSDITVTIEGTPVKVCIDSGATANTIDYATYEAICAAKMVPLKPTNVKLRPYGEDNPAPKDYQLELNIDPAVQPVVQNSRPTPLHYRARVEAKLKQLEDQDIIEQVTGPTPWVSPLVIVDKPNGDVRLCANMCRLNEALRRTHHPYPTSEEILQDLKGSKFFSKIDLKECYHSANAQVERFNT